MSGLEAFDEGISIGLLLLGFAVSIGLAYLSYRLIVYIKNHYEAFSGNTIQVVIKKKKESGSK